MTAPTLRPPSASSLSGSIEQPTFSEAVGDYVRRVRGGDMGSLPAVLALAALVLGFVLLKPETFPSALNIANLFQQGAVVVTIAMGLVFVLLLGAIDLSAGFASGVCGAVLATTLTDRHWPWYSSLAVTLLTGLVIGLLIGLMVARVGIPSFVVTLAAFLAFQGIVLLIIGAGGNVSITDPVIIAIQNKNVPPTVGWVLAVAAVATYALASLRTWRHRRSRGADHGTAGAGRREGGRPRSRGVRAGVRPQPGTQPQPGARVDHGRADRGADHRRARPGTGVRAHRTAFGRHIYAVGGNAEATRRAGIPVAGVRMTCSTMAAVAGVFAASRATSVDPNAGGSNVLLYAVGAAVIGGTSLFGGKGRIIDALIGGAVIDNGMGLLGYSAGIKYVVTGGVLAAAAAVDALSRRRARATGRV